jgi:cation:H+ antiporter
MKRYGGFFMEKFFSEIHIVFLFAFLILSFFILIKSSDFLVKSAVGLSRSMGLSEMLIGATIVSLGTTLPEFTSSVFATLGGAGGFALGNAVGSTITNICMVLGIGALFGTIPVNRRSLRNLSILAVGIFILIFSSLPGRVLPKYTGILFVVFIPFYVFYMVKKGGITEPEEKIIPEGKTFKKNILRVIFVIISAVFVAMGAAVLTYSVENIALRFGVPEAVISATIVAFGTSVPELSTTYLL